MERADKTIAVENRIRKNVGRFDLVSLIRLLRHIGYDNRQIRFKSYNSQLSQKSLIQSVRFRKWPEKIAELTLNMGLLSPQAPLPSYFQKIIDKGMIDVNAFYQFINFFDHPLAASFVTSVMPEENTRLFPDWGSTKLSYIKMLDLKSVNTLHWFLSLYFPELELRVDKTRNPRQIETNPFILGRAVIGDTATFGDRTTIVAQGVRITLFAQEERTGKDLPWPREIRDRLETHVFPVLAAVGMDVEVVLVIKDQQTWARLERNSYLGYDKVQGGSNPLRRIKIFNGHLIH
ncbi:type VI secretion system baseplate subunit TssG [Desulfobacter vibrioformis]|uniref:type VI secretion system baseplate subunit TssG n=1 Tax=Desulfobacter vibrioformis TaxID=34031 RepID=UPI000557A2AE|nr:type VI secretion system baseplate subunit TssG [Desulfobacter vibrioformis]